jgi:hypothetical protein
MAHSPEIPFQARTDVQKIHYIFDLAYEASDYSQADDYPEADLEELTARSRDSLAEFAGKIMAMRYTLQANTLPDATTLHSLDATSGLTGNFYEVKHPLITYTLDSLSGTDTRGKKVIADRLTVYSPDDQAKVEAEFTRMNLSSSGVQPLSYRYPPGIMDGLRRRLESIITW